MQSLPGQPDHVRQHQAAQRILAQELPSIPLFPRLTVMAAQPDIHNIQLDPAQTSVLWNLYAIDMKK
jgi:ABC-type transport system substrate-binding protein